MMRRSERPSASSPLTRRLMQSIGKTNTRKERELRSLLHRAGLRFRVHIKPLPNINRRADVIFTRLKIAVFIDGCFWHGCPLHSHVPRTNEAFWRKKLEGNRSRDNETNLLLAANGWVVLRYWEHCDMTDAAREVEKTIRMRRAALAGYYGKESRPVEKNHTTNKRV